MRRLVLGLVLSSAMALPLMAGSAAAGHDSPGIAVNGEVSSPTSYTMAQLGSVTQTSVSVAHWGPKGTRTVTVTGVALETLVTLAQPAYPALPNSKNRLLRVTVTVRGQHHRAVTFALGELDPNFGNHPALLALSSDGVAFQDGPELVVPADRSPARSVPEVREVTVGIATGAATTPPAPGSVILIDGGRHVVLSSATLAGLRQSTVTVTFGAGGGPQTHTETGPSLRSVLAAGGIRSPGITTWVEAVGTDNYAAVVTPAEASVGGRPILLALAQDGTSLAQPRLVVDGDVKGGRYVSDVVDLYAGRGPAS